MLGMDKDDVGTVQMFKLGGADDLFCEKTIIFSSQAQFLSDL